MRVFNFAAGPATMPLAVLEQARAELSDWRGSGMSVMEVSHRSKPFMLIAREAERLVGIERIESLEGTDEGAAAAEDAASGAADAAPES